MKTSNYIYGVAANNMHGKMEDAVNAGILTKDEAERYNYVAIRIMSGRRFEGEFPVKTQFKLDEFFKKEEIDYCDFKNLCREQSGDPLTTACCLDSFLKGDRCYYNDKGETVTVNFVSRFTSKNQEKAVLRTSIIKAALQSFIDADLSKENHHYDHWEWIRLTAAQIYDDAAIDEIYLTVQQLIEAVDNKMHGC